MPDPNLIPFKPGDPPSADALNLLVQAIQRLRIRGGQGTRLSGNRLDAIGPDWIWGHLTDNTWPTPFFQVMEDTGGTWKTVPNGITGTNAYEVHGITGLKDQIVKLRPSTVGDWRFQVERSIGPCIDNTCCLFLHNLCGFVITGASVTVTDTTSSTTYTGTIDPRSGVFCFPYDPSHTYTVDMSIDGGTLGSHSLGTCSGSAMALNPIHGALCRWNADYVLYKVHTTGCCGVTLPGVTVTVTDRTDSSTIGTCTTDSSGNCCFIGPQGQGPPYTGLHWHGSVDKYNDLDQDSTVYPNSPSGPGGCDVYGLDFGQLHITKWPASLPLIDPLGNTITLTPTVTDGGVYTACKLYDDPDNKFVDFCADGITGAFKFGAKVPISYVYSCGQLSIQWPWYILGSVYGGNLRLGYLRGGMSCADFDAHAPGTFACDGNEDCDPYTEICVPYCKDGWIMHGTSFHACNKVMYTGTITLPQSNGIGGFCTVPFTGFATSNVLGDLFPGGGTWSITEP